MRPVSSLCKQSDLLIFLTFSLVICSDAQGINNDLLEGHGEATVTSKEAADESPVTDETADTATTTSHSAMPTTNDILENSSSLLDVDNSQRKKDMEFFEKFNYFFNFWTQTAIRCFGIIGNIINMFILSRLAFQAKNSYNILLLSLAVADMITLIIGLPLNILIENSFFFKKVPSFEWQLYVYYGLFTFGYVSICAGNWTTTMVSIQRCIAVCIPLKCNMLCSLKRTRVATVTIWLFSIILFSVNYLNYRIEYVNEGNSTRPVFVKGVLSWPLYEIIMNNVQIALCSYVPWFISFCAIVRIGMKLKLDTPEHDSIRRSQQRAQQETKITVMLTSVVFVYLICSIPTSVRYIIRTLDTAPVYYSKGIPYMVLDGLANFGIAFNSAINIVLYSATNSNYQTIFISFMCPCYRKGQLLNKSTSNIRLNETRVTVSTLSLELG